MSPFDFRKRRNTEQIGAIIAVASLVELMGSGVVLMSPVYGGPGIGSRSKGGVPP